MNLVLVGRAMGSVPYRSGMLLTTTVSFVSKKKKPSQSSSSQSMTSIVVVWLISARTLAVFLRRFRHWELVQLSLNHDPLARSTVGRSCIIQCLIVPPYRFTVEDDRDDVDSSSDGWKVSECCCLLSGKRATVANCPICFSFVSYNLVRL